MVSMFVQERDNRAFISVCIELRDFYWCRVRQLWVVIHGEPVLDEVFGLGSDLDSKDEV